MCQKTRFWLNFAKLHNIAVTFCTKILTKNWPSISWVDNISISLPLIGGCTDSTALNFNPAAQVDDGSCYLVGCTHPHAMYVTENATIDDGTCEFLHGCTDSTACNFVGNIELF